MFVLILFYSPMQDDERLFDEDLAFEEYKQKRLAELYKKANQKIVETFTDEYALIQKTKRDRMIVHFFDDSFEKCKIMDHNLLKICKVFKDIEFIRIDAKSAPTLTTKLGIKALPFVGMFRDGFFVDQIVGFEGLGHDSFEPEDLIKFIRLGEMFKK